MDFFKEEYVISYISLAISLITAFLVCYIEYKNSKRLNEKEFYRTLYNGLLKTINKAIENPLLLCEYYYFTEYKGYNDLIEGQVKIYNQYKKIYDDIKVLLDDCSKEYAKYDPYDDSNIIYETFEDGKEITHLKNSNLTEQYANLKLNEYIKANLCRIEKIKKNILKLKKILLKNIRK